MPGHRRYPGGQVGDGETAGGDGKCPGCGQHGPHPGLVQVQAAGAGGADLGGQRQFVEQAAWDEAGIDAVQHGAEPPGHAGQPGDDVGKFSRPRPAYLPMVTLIT